MSSSDISLHRPFGRTVSIPPSRDSLLEVSVHRETQSESSQISRVHTQSSWAWEEDSGLIPVRMRRASAYLTD